MCQSTYPRFLMGCTEGKNVSFIAIRMRIHQKLCSSLTPSWTERRPEAMPKFLIVMCISGILVTPFLVHGPDRVTVHPPRTVWDQVFLLLGPPPISKVDAIKKKLGWTTCFGPFSQWPPSKYGNHVLCHNMSSEAVRVTKLVHMFLGARNSNMPIKNVSVLWKTFKQLFTRIFRAFSVIFCVSPWAREGYCAPST